VTFGDSLTPGRNTSKSSARDTPTNVIVEEVKDDMEPSPNRNFHVSPPNHT
jgi:hypothetical protein